MTVYAVNSPNVDFSTALPYGDVKHINVRYVYPDELEGSDNSLPAPVRRMQLAAAVAFNPESDYLLIAGDHLQLVAFAALLGVRYSSFKVLRWDRQIEGYAPACIKVPVVDPPIVSA